MPVTVRELRAGEVEAALEAADRCGIALQPESVVRRLSLLAAATPTEEGAAGPDAVLLCVRGEEGRLSLHLAAADETPEKTVNLLMDKATLKARAAGQCVAAVSVATPAQQAAVQRSAWDPPETLRKPT